MTASPLFSTFKGGGGLGPHISHFIEYSMNVASDLEKKTKLFTIYLNLNRVKNFHFRILNDLWTVGKSSSQPIFLNCGGLRPSTFCFLGEGWRI